MSYAALKGQFIVDKRLQENIMGVMPVKRLLLHMGVPIMISMLVQALYNVVDSIFVSRISENALTAVSMAFPMQNLLISFSVGFGVGINALVSRALGAGDGKRANIAARNGLFLQAISYLIFLILGLSAVELYMRAQTNVEEIVQYGIEYLRIVLIFSFGLFAEISFERFLQSTGRAKYAMITQLCGAVFNIVFDPILIYGLLGFPALGIAGAAWATVGGQIFGALAGLYLCVKKNPELSISLKGFRPDGAMIGEMCRISIPSIVMTSVTSVMTFGMDIILHGFSSTAVAVFGVYYKLQSFAFMPVFGLNNALVPTIAFNYGAKKPERIHEAVKYGMLYASAIMFAGLLLLQLFPKELLLLFDAQDYMLSIGIPALRIISVHYLLAGVCIVCSASCQAFGYGVYSLIISCVRQLAALLPAAWLLSLTGRLNLIWLSFPIAECVSIALCLPLLRLVLKKTGMSVRAAER